MPYPKSAASKGGKKGGRAPASDNQKAIARQTALQHQPSQFATGPKSEAGKFASSRNAVKTRALRFCVAVKSWDPDVDFWQRCSEVEAAIAQLEQIKQAFEFRQDGVSLAIEIETSKEIWSDSQGRRWALYKGRLKRTKFKVNWCSRSLKEYEAYEQMKQHGQWRMGEAVRQIRQVIEGVS